MCLHYRVRYDPTSNLYLVVKLPFLLLGTYVLENMLQKTEEKKKKIFFVRSREQTTNVMSFSLKAFFFFLFLLLSSPPFPQSIHGHHCCGQQILFFQTEKNRICPDLLCRMLYEASQSELLTF